MTETLLLPEEATLPEPPDISHLITEDDEPVDGIFSERQMRLLANPLFVSWPGPPGEEPRPFVVLANVGLFYSIYQPAIVPDVLLSVDVQLPDEVFEKRHRSYFIWEYGKPPDVVIEIVSNKRGGEDGEKMRRYAALGIPYYVIYDPEQHLSQTTLRIFVRHGADYVETQERWLPEVGLGLTLWEGTYEHLSGTWLRWCDAEGNPIPTGAEAAQQERQRAEQERQRAEQEQQRAERLAAQLRALGVDPDA